MFKVFHLPLLRGSAWLMDYYPEMAPGPRWYHVRGRCREHIFGMPLFTWQLEFHGRGQSYRKLVGAPEYLNSLDWILDEFDASFNALAVASLRYHMDFSVCDNRDRRARYQALVDRLTEPRPHVCDTDEKRAVWREYVAQKRSLEWELSNPMPPEIAAMFDDHRKREDEYLARINQARHDFVDIIPELWS